MADIKPELTNSIQILSSARCVIIIILRVMLNVHLIISDSLTDVNKFYMFTHISQNKISMLFFEIHPKTSTKPNILGLPILHFLSGGSVF